MVAEQVTTTGPAEDANRNGPSSVWKRLVTVEDPFHVHKILGILCLLSYTWRLPLVGAQDMGFASYPQWTMPTIVLHFMLNASSFVFHIPQRRIKAGGYRIWPEYRAHSLVFLCRSLIYMTLVWFEQTYQVECSRLLNLAIVLGSCAAADVSSMSQGELRSNTIRGLSVPYGVKYFFSVAQILATTAVLWGLRRYSTQFVFCWIIQCNAFLMTLQRKNVGSHGFLIFIYGALIVIGSAMTNYDQIYYGESAYTMNGMSVIAHTAALLRFGPRWIPVVQNNKYILWTCMYLVAQQLRPLLKRMEDPEDDQATFLFYVVTGYGQITMVMMVALGFYKSRAHSVEQAANKAKEA